MDELRYVSCLTTRFGKYRKNIGILLGMAKMAKNCKMGKCSATYGIYPFYQFLPFHPFTHFCHFAICRIRWQACGDSRVGFEVRSWGSEVRFEGRGVSKKPCQSRVSRWVCLPHSMYVVYIHCIYSVYILCICMVQGVRCDSRGGVGDRVRMQLSPYDLSRGRITWRMRSERMDR